MDLLRKASHVLVCGRSGQGKTSYGERYIAGSHHARVFIFDWQGEFAGRLRIPPVYDLEEIGENPARIIAFDPSEHFGGHFEEVFGAFCDIVMFQAKQVKAKSGLDCLLVCDELQRLIPVQDPPQELRNVLQTGRRAGLDTLLLSQQPNRLHNEVREQFTEIAFFKMTDTRSLEFVESRGVDPERISKLETLHYLWFNTLTDETRDGLLKF